MPPANIHGLGGANQPAHANAAFAGQGRVLGPPFFTRRVNIRIDMPAWGVASLVIFLVAATSCACWMVANPVSPRTAAGSDIMTHTNPGMRIDTVSIQDPNLGGGTGVDLDVVELNGVDLKTKQCETSDKETDEDGDEEEEETEKNPYLEELCRLQYRVGDSTGRHWTSVDLGVFLESGGRWARHEDFDSESHLDGDTCWETMSSGDRSPAAWEKVVSEALCKSCVRHAEAVAAAAAAADGATGAEAGQGQTEMAPGQEDKENNPMKNIQRQHGDVKGHVGKQHAGLSHAQQQMGRQVTLLERVGHFLRNEKSRAVWLVTIHQDRLERDCERYSNNNKRKGRGGMVKAKAKAKGKGKGKQEQGQEHEPKKEAKSP